MIKKAVVLIFDGLGDRPVKEFGNKTPLEYANTPHLDHLAGQGQCGLMYSLGRGLRPGSDVSHLEILGYPIKDYYTGRGPIEVAGLGFQLKKGDVALRGNFATVDAAWGIIDRRAGRITNVDVFAKAINGIIIDGIEFIVLAGTAHRAGVVMRGPGLSSNISDSDPHEEGKPVGKVMPLDKSAEAIFTAEVLNKFLRKSHELLSNFEPNREREKAGKLPCNFCLTRGAGLVPHIPSFKEKFGLSACCIAGGGLYKGVGALLGMDVIHVEGATALPDTNIRAKFLEVIEKNKHYDFIFCHVKATDSLGEDGNYRGKKDFIEKADKEIPVLFNLPDDTVLFIGADHSTPCELKAHSADPVPVLFTGKSSIRVDDVNEYNETACAKGNLGIIYGKDVILHILNIMGSLHLIGA